MHEKGKLISSNWAITLKKKSANLYLLVTSNCKYFLYGLSRDLKKIPLFHQVEQ